MNVRNRFAILIFLDKKLRFQDLIAGRNGHRCTYLHTYLCHHHRRVVIVTATTVPVLWPPLSRPAALLVVLPPPPPAHGAAVAVADVAVVVVVPAAAAADDGVLSRRAALAVHLGVVHFEVDRLQEREKSACGCE